MQLPDLNSIALLLSYKPEQPLLFNSGLFFWLFLIFISGFYVIHKKQLLKLIYVITFSLYFYYLSSGWYFLLLVLCTVVDYWIAKAIYNTAKPFNKKLLLIFSLSYNLGTLAYFKYTNFFFEIYTSISGGTFDPYQIFLPVGVSFFTFQSLSYTIDVYRRELTPAKNILEYAFFVSFFPQLVAGPIVRAKDFLPQIDKPVFVSSEMFGRGVMLICAGLIKKAIISDYISTNFVDRIFDNPTLYTGLENLFGVYGYALQIYCDFSGYSDMAIGIALLLGYELCVNFNSPYQSTSITEFWRRWHISLSTWLRDYLYISLGGNRHGKWRTYINQFITMLLGGLWHGAAMKFVFWGMLHGVALGFDKFRMQLMQSNKTISGSVITGGFVTFHFVCFCWIFFRADDMLHVQQMLGQIIMHFNIGILPEFVSGYKAVLAMLAMGYTLHFLPARLKSNIKNIIVNSPFGIKVALIVFTILLVGQFKSAELQPFIYFQF